MDILKKIRRAEEKLVALEEELLEVLQSHEADKSLFLYRVGGEGLCVAYYTNPETEEIESDLDEIGIPVSEALRRKEEGIPIF